MVPTCPKGLCLPRVPAGGTFCTSNWECVCPVGSLLPGVLPCPQRCLPLPQGLEALPACPRVLFWGSCCHSHGVPTCPGGYLHVHQGLRVPKCNWGTLLVPGVAQGSPSVLGIGDIPLPWESPLLLEGYGVPVYPWVPPYAPGMCVPQLPWGWDVPKFPPCPHLGVPTCPVPNRRGCAVCIQRIPAVALYPGRAPLARVSPLFPGSPSHIPVHPGWECVLPQE